MSQKGSLDIFHIFESQIVRSKSAHQIMPWSYHSHAGARVGWDSILALSVRSIDMGSNISFLKTVSQMSQKGSSDTLHIFENQIVRSKSAHQTMPWSYHSLACDRFSWDIILSSSVPSIDMGSSTKLSGPLPVLHLFFQFSNWVYILLMHCTSAPNSKSWS